MTELDKIDAQFNQVMSSAQTLLELVGTITQMVTVNRDSDHIEVIRLKKAILEAINMGLMKVISPKVH